MAPVYRLLQFTDLHLFADPDGEMRGSRTLDTLVQTLAEAKRKHWPPDAILVTGDIAQDETPGAYAIFREHFADLGAPVMCIPGNHDNPEFMQELKAPFQYCGSAGFGDWLVVMLNSNNPGDAGGMLQKDQLDQLGATLTASREKHVLICLHHHPVSSGSRWLDTVALRNASQFWDIVDQHDHVRGLLWGHVHQAFEEQRNGLLLMSTPSTCRQFLPNADKFALDEDRQPAYRWLHLHPDGTIVTAINWCDGTDT